MQTFSAPSKSLRFAAFLFLVVVFPLIAATSALAQKAEDDKKSSRASKLDAKDLFKHDHIVDIRIKVSEENWDHIRNQSRSFGESLTKKENTSPFDYVKADLTVDGVEIKNVGLRKKGFLGSLDTNRPSLKIKFSEYEKQEPIRGIDRLTLNNNKQDASRICQYISYRMFNDSGTFAPRCNFAKVYVNDKYLGIYSNVESIRKPFLERGFKDASGALFEGTIADFFPDFVQRFERKNKKAKYELIQEVTDVLAQEEVDLEKLTTLVNVDAFVRYWVIESLICYWDGYCNNQNNFFIYHNPEDSKFYFIPWGTDAIFSETMPLPPYRIRPRSVHCQSILANRLYRIPEIRKQYQETMMKFLDDHFNEEKMTAEIDQLEAFLGDHVMESNRGFARQMRRFRTFVKNRRKDIMKEFEDGPPELPARERQPVYFGTIGKATVTFSTKWFDKTPKEVYETGDLEIEMELNGEKVQFEEVGVYAERSRAPTFGSSNRPPSIVVVGKRKKDGKKLTLGVGVTNSKQFAPSKDSVPLAGMFIEGNRFVGPGGAMRMIGGTVQLDSASAEDGEDVKGKLELTIIQMNGGKPVEDK